MGINRCILYKSLGYLFDTRLFEHYHRKACLCLCEQEISRQDSASEQSGQGIFFIVKSIEPLGSQGEFTR